MEFASIKTISVNWVGNKILDEDIAFSKSELIVTEETAENLSKYFLSSFKEEEYYSFFHESELGLNEVYVYATEIFNSPDSLFDQSIKLAKHLYEKSNHPKIKGGEFYTVYFKDCVLNGETVDAVGLFKSENKDTFLKVFPTDDGFSIESDKGININKLDKGCLIFNTDKENGYVVAVVDNTNKGAEAQYWIDDFLHVLQRKDEYYNTRQLLSMTKSFVTDAMPQHFVVSKADQVDLLNKSVKFFKDNDSFDMDEFANGVMVQPALIDSFYQFRDDYKKDREIDIADNFNISESAVKRQARAFKSVIKLDKNFHIYIHGDRDMIEQGSDERGKFYKMYYQKEE